MSSCPLRPEAIKEAITAQVATILPTTKIYTDVIPRDFKRPSVLVEVTGGRMLPLAGNKKNVPLQWMARLTGFVETDAVHDSHLVHLDTIGWELETMWADGYLRIADRAVDIDEVALETTGYDFVVVTVKLSAMVDRASLLPKRPPLPVIRDVAVNQTDIIE